MTSPRAPIAKKIGRIRPMMLDDQVKLNDPGASQYLIETLAQGRLERPATIQRRRMWRLRNRSGDDARAAQGYAAAVLYPDAPADAWRWHGITLMKAGRTAEAQQALRALSGDEAQRARCCLGPADGGLRGVMTMNNVLGKSRLPRSPCRLGLLDPGREANMASAIIR